MKKYKVGITFGAFDILHIGHLNLLKRAKKECEKLIVCVSDDKYVFRYKRHLPMLPYAQRRACIRALPFIDTVDVQSETFRKRDAVHKYKPDVILVGSDWSKKTFGGEGLGVKVVYLPRTEGISSTDLRDI